MQDECIAGMRLCPVICRPSLWRGAGRRVALLLVALSVLRWQWPTLPPDGPRLRCLDVFRLSRHRYPWDSASSGGCLPRPLHPAEVHDRLRRRAAATGRPTRVVFVGDSRMRIIYLRCTERLGLKKHLRDPDETPLPEAAASSNVTGALPDCTEAFHLMLNPGKKLGSPLFLHTPCSMRSADESLQLHYWYRPYFTHSFDATLWALASRCTSQPDACPALVVINTGLWYARRFSITIQAAAADWILRFRSDLAARRAALARLAAATTVLWKLEEPSFSREVDGFPPDITSAALLVMQALTQAEAPRVPGLTVWSSALPESGRYERRTCGSWPRKPGEPKRAVARDTGDCRDKNHVGNAVLDGQTDTIFDYLYEESPVRSTFSQFCCGGA